MSSDRKFFIIILVVVLVALILVSILGIIFPTWKNFKRNFFNESWEYTLVNNTDQELKLVTFRLAGDFDEDRRSYIEEFWTMQPGEIKPRFYSRCLFVVDDQGGEMRSFNLNENIFEWIKLEDGELRKLYLGDNGVACRGKRDQIHLSDIEACRIRNQYLPLSECLPKQ